MYNVNANARFKNGQTDAFKALQRETSHKIGSDNILIRRRIYILQTGRETPPQWGVLSVKGNMEERAQKLALYIIENKATVRAAASRFGVSKSTVHKDLSERLPAINRGLYRQVKEILNENKAERHIRGGIATRKKYKGC